MKGWLTVLAVLVSAPGLAGCSGKQAYEGLQAGQRSQCIKLPEPDRARCQESTSLRHEDYEAQRGK